MTDKILVFLFFTGFFIFSLLSCSHLYTVEEQVEIPQEEEKIVTHDELASAFVFLTKKTSSITCMSTEANQTYCRSTIGGISASGVVVKKDLDDETTIILTANHFCEMNLEGEEHPETYREEDIIAHTHNGKSYLSHVIAQDSTNDLCLVATTTIDSAYAPEWAKTELDPGARVKNFAAPQGVWDSAIQIEFDGQYQGATGPNKNKIGRTEINTAYYTLNAFLGSSGSPIFNEKGELNGLLTEIQFPGFISMGPRWSIILRFLEDHLGE